jgi:hypothetical protein
MKNALALFNEAVGPSTHSPIRDSFVAAAARPDGVRSFSGTIIDRGQSVDLPQFIQVVPCSLFVETMDDIVSAGVRVILKIETFDLDWYAQIEGQPP